jgi:hypothetical protein
MLNVRERREAQAKREAVELLDEIGPERAAELLNVHLTTVKRWYTGEVVAQGPVLIALRTLAGRHWDNSPDWERWTIRDNALFSPGGERFYPGDLIGLRYLRQLQKHQERQIRLLRAKLAEVTDGAANDAVEGEVAPLTDQGLDFAIGRQKRS